MKNTHHGFKPESFVEKLLAQLSYETHHFSFLDRQITPSWLSGLKSSPAISLAPSPAGTYTGTSGNDTIRGTSGADTMSGGAGHDLYFVNSISDVVLESPNQGIDTVRATVNYTLAEDVENLILEGAARSGYGNDLNNKLTGNGLANTLFGGGGDDFIDGGAGIDRMTGDLGNDTFIVDHVNDRIVEHFNEGIDTVRSSVSYAIGYNIENIVLTGAASINATGNDLANRIWGNAGDNIIDGGAKIDIMTGGAGNDYYYVDNFRDGVVESLNQGNDTVFSTSIYFRLGANIENLIVSGMVYEEMGGVNRYSKGIGNELNNTITGLGDMNWLEGGAGDDIIYGADISDGLDVLYGGSGNDTIYGNEGKDTIYGDDGDDVIDAGTGKYSNLNGGNGNDIIRAIEGANTVHGGAGNDSIYCGGSGEIHGDAGDDFIDAGAGRVFGGDGNDTISGEGSMYGNLGDDVYIIKNGNAIAVEVANAGTDLVRSAVNYTLGVEIENLILEGQAVSGSGNSAVNTISGNQEDNKLYGLGGDDIIVGNAGRDLISGGYGNDTLTGGSGSDAFVFEVKINTAGFVNSDVVTDFNVMEDVIDLSALGLNSNGSDVQFYATADGYRMVVADHMLSIQLDGLTAADIGNVHILYTASDVAAFWM